MSNQIQYAGFPNLDSAKQHRTNHGGWIFAAESGEAIWFSLPYTPSKIIGHPATRGLSGKLV